MLRPPRAPRALFVRPRRARAMPIATRALVGPGPGPVPFDVPPPFSWPYVVLTCIFVVGFADACRHLRRQVGGRLKYNFWMDDVDTHHLLPWADSIYAVSRDAGVDEKDDFDLELLTCVQRRHFSQNASAEKPEAAFLLSWTDASACERFLNEANARGVRDMVMVGSGNERYVRVRYGRADAPAMKRVVLDAPTFFSLPYVGNVGVALVGDLPILHEFKLSEGDASVFPCKIASADTDVSSLRSAFARRTP